MPLVMASRFDVELARLKANLFDTPQRSRTMSRLQRNGACIVTQAHSGTRHKLPPKAVAKLLKYQEREKEDATKTAELRKAVKERDAWRRAVMPKCPGDDPGSPMQHHMPDITKDRPDHRMGYFAPDFDPPPGCSMPRSLHKHEIPVARKSSDEPPSSSAASTALGAASMSGTRRPRAKSTSDI